MATTHLLLLILALAAGGPAAPGDPFTLRVGESQIIEEAGLTLRFTAVPQDSRCPVDVSCIVAGDAQVVFEADFESESVKLIFQVPPAGRDRQKLGRFTLTLTALEPQTASTRRIEPADYIATMVVTAGSP